MSNFIEYKDKFAFHPGYYIEEYVEESKLTQEDFAKRLDTTPKNLSLLIRGEQKLTPDIATKLSLMLGTSITYWLNIQSTYDTILAEIKMEEEINKEKEILRDIDYSYFVEYFNLPSLPRKILDQVVQLRKFLGVSTLSVFKRRDMAVSFRTSTGEMNESNIIKANIMVQIAVNSALQSNLIKYNKKKFEEAIKYALTLTTEHDTFLPKIKEAFANAGVFLVLLPNMKGSKINGATKKIGENILLMINDRRFFSDSFWFTLFHEVGHIINGDFGISFDNDIGEQEEKADKFSQDCLINPISYKEFISKRKFDLKSIKIFGQEINRDPAIILGRLQHDGYVRFDNKSMQSLRYKYKVI